MVIFMIRKSDALRLLFNLDNYSCDSHAIDLISHALNYIPSQLQKDIEALVAYVSELEYKCEEDE